ncbi:MAG: glycosyltransferase [Erysipelotrichales bacterium]|nr:glycosyltransferase [Erysipelotrichales bacterium]
MKKKVMFLSLSKGFSGIERQVTTLANSLVDLYDISLFFVDDVNPELKIDSKIKVIIKNKKLLENKMLYYRELVKDIDVVISTSHVFNKYLSKLQNKKTIYWHHDKFEQVNTKDLKNFNQIIVSNRDNYEYFVSFNDNVIIINTAIIIPENQSNLENDNIVFVGKLIPNKNVLDLIQIFSWVLKELYLNLYIIGEGPERKKLETYVNTRNIENVFFKGTINQEEIESILTHSSLYVSCSEGESAGFSVLEAMSYGIPIVAFDDVKIFSLFVIDEINGYLIKNRNKEEMKKRIIELMNNLEMRKEFGNCSREKILEFDINSVKREWIKII